LVWIYLQQISFYFLNNFLLSCFFICFLVFFIQTFPEEATH